MSGPRRRGVPAEAERFLRFVIARRDPDSARPQGRFAPAYELVRSGELDRDAHDRLKLALEWFQSHLPSPDRSRIRPRGIFWFKADAAEVVRRMGGIARVVEASGRATTLIRTGKPGYILDEDAFQVCAVPFKDTAA